MEDGGEKNKKLANEQSLPYEVRKVKWSIMKNVVVNVVISIAFMINFTAYQAMAPLQSSLNSDLCRRGGTRRA